MTAQDQALLDAIRVIVGEALVPLTERMDGMTERMDGMTERMDGMTERMDGMTERMDGMTARLDRLDTHVARLEERVETIDTRTNQMSVDLLDLRDRVPVLEERVESGFRALKSDLNFAFSDARKALTTQRSYDKAIDALRQELANVQQRLTALERARSDS